MLASKKPLKHSAKRYLTKVVDCVERLQTELTIASKELEQLRAVVEGRRRQRTGKRLVIKDQILLTTRKLVERLKAAEAETQAKKGKRKQKRIRLKLNLKKRD
jgi:hypothetical protein